MELSLSTAQLVLRPWADGDRGAVAEAATDPYISSVTSVPRVYSDAAADRFIAQLHALARANEAVPLAISDRTSGAVLGHISLRLRDLDLGRASVGYWVLPRARRRGVASEALAALSGWAFETLNVARLELYIEPWNEGSVRVAERAGFTREGLLRGWQVMGGVRRDMYMYGRVAP